MSAKTPGITRDAYAKINLGLDVTGRRADGYHLVRMIMQTISLHDTLTFTIGEKELSGQVRLSTSSGQIPSGPDNLVCRAVEILRKECGFPEGVDITLEKRIPVAAGMAGGSTDAAAAFRAINDLFSLGLSDERLCELATPLGADIPYCIMGGTALSEGIGEVLTALPDLPDCHILIAKPPVAVATKWIYTELDSKPIEDHPDIDGMTAAIRDGSLQGVIDRLGNVLEPVTRVQHPVIGEIEQLMLDHGALGSMMSGSGPTVFGIFDSEQTIQTAYDAVRASGLAPELFCTKPVTPAH